MVGIFCTAAIQSVPGLIIRIDAKRGMALSVRSIDTYENILPYKTLSCYLSYHSSVGSCACSNNIAASGSVNCSLSCLTLSLSSLYICLLAGSFGSGKCGELILIPSICRWYLALSLILFYLVSPMLQVSSSIAFL